VPQLHLIYRAVRKAHADERAKQRVMPDVAYFAKQATQFLANLGAKLRALQDEGHVPALFPQARVRLCREHMR
jgi:hypothetical protein